MATNDSQFSLLDLLPEDDSVRKMLQKEKSTDWKWTLKDYPAKNGLKAFSCFACGGGQQWATNWLV